MGTRAAYIYSPSRTNEISSVVSVSAVVGCAVAHCCSAKSAEIDILESPSFKLRLGEPSASNLGVTSMSDMVGGIALFLSDSFRQ